MNFQGCSLEAWEGKGEGSHGPRGGQPAVLTAETVAPGQGTPRTLLGLQRGWEGLGDPPHPLFLCSSGGTGGWSARGCELLSRNRTHVACRCNHAASSAVLMDVSRREVGTSPRAAPPTWPVRPGTRPSGKSAWPQTHPSASSPSPPKGSEQTDATTANCLPGGLARLRTFTIKAPRRGFQGGHVVS